ncbi:MAG: relaxase/mobilization nuclease domain-containing protein, partial [Alphaproteobacteria bacterium]|nr:relaxase/mobilization nuclease domain-containing protein [Alphaproteobacteria bacterium]
RAERIWKSLTSGGSAFVKRIPGAGVQHPTQLAGQLAYVNGNAKAIFGFATDICAEGDAFAQADLDKMMEAWAQDWHGRPRNGHTSHMVLSFPDDVSQESAVLIAQEWCAEMFESELHVADTCEYVAALHTDTANPHVHVVLNNRGAGGGVVLHLYRGRIQSADDAGPHDRFCRDDRCTDDRQPRKTLSRGLVRRQRRPERIWIWISTST